MVLTIPVKQDNKCVILVKHCYTHINRKLCELEFLFSSGKSNDCKQSIFNTELVLFKLSTI